MNPEIQKLWSTALRSGKYKQTIGVLARLEEDAETPAGFCCLGVLCELAHDAGIVDRTVSLLLPPGDGECNGYRYGPVDGGSVSYLPGKVSSWVGINSGTVWFDVTDYHSPNLSAEFLFAQTVERRLGGGFFVQAETLNDTYGFTFDQIADLIDSGRIIDGD